MGENRLRIKRKKRILQRKKKDRQKTKEQHGKRIVLNVQDGVFS